MDNVILRHVVSQFHIKDLLIANGLLNRLPTVSAAGCQGQHYSSCAECRKNETPDFVSHILTAIQIRKVSLTLLNVVLISLLRALHV